MGGRYTPIDTNNLEVKKYASRIGTLITLLNTLDDEIENFIEAILELENNKKTTANIYSLIRNFMLHKRLDFLLSLIKTKHPDKIDEYMILHNEISKYNKIRNTFAHGLAKFFDDEGRIYMQMYNIRKTESNSSEKLYEKITLEELDNHIKQIRALIEKFASFTYELDYFQG